jgi:hypoxanthine-DNA glycosylase
MSHATGFSPVVGPTSRVLILGSMPGRVSLEAGEYYAQARNVFWRIMGELFGAGPDHPYQERLKLLMANGIALWDVLESCYRPGSLDAAIDVTTATTNDFARLFGTHPSIARVFFNGGKAEELYRRRVLPTLQATAPHLVYQRLPSTSPAHAAMPYAQKLARWSVLKPWGG